MDTQFSSIPNRKHAAVSRRQFVTGSVAAAASLALANSSPAQDAASRPELIKAGLVGCGGRGSLIGSLFKEHGAFDLFAVADYFQPVADTLGEKLGVDKSRRFSGLSGYQKLIDTGVEAVILEDLPWFMPDQAEAAAKAGCHVYMAKPVAVDVPGALQVEAAARIASEKRRCFFVDYQIPTDPFNQEVVNPCALRSYESLARMYLLQA